MEFCTNTQPHKSSTRVKQLGYGQHSPTSHLLYNLSFKSLSVDVRRMQFAILAQSPREMALLTDRILPRYFWSRVRISIRPRFFCIRQKTPGQTSPRPGRMLQRHRPSERCNLKRRLYLHAMWRLTTAAGGYG